MTNNTKKFYYKASRDLISGAIGTVLTIVGFFILKALLGLLEEWDERIRTINTFCICIYIIIAVPLVLGYFVSTYIKTYSVLIISKEEIIEKGGWLTKYETNIPAYKIKSCSKSSGVIQRLCNTMDIAITTAGDMAEIKFHNIEKGEEAYNILVQLARANKHQ